MLKFLAYLAWPVMIAVTIAFAITTVLGVTPWFLVVVPFVTYAIVGLTIGQTIWILYK